MCFGGWGDGPELPPGKVVELPEQAKKLNWKQEIVSKIKALFH